MTDLQYNPLDRLLSGLRKVRRTGAGRWIACCPAHNDRSPSLAISDKDGRILLHCFAGCETEDVLAAIGMTFSDLMPERLPEECRSESRPFYASDVLAIVAQEAWIVFACASDIWQDKELSEADRERLLLAVCRIDQALEIAEGTGQKKGHPVKAALLKNEATHTRIVPPVSDLSQSISIGGHRHAAC